MNLLEVTIRNIKQIKAKKCFVCHKELLKQIDGFLYYTAGDGYRRYFCSKECSIQSENMGFSQKVINELEEQSNMNMLFIYGRDKNRPPGIFKRLHTRGYLTYGGKLTEKALSILNKEKI